MMLATIDEIEVVGVLDRGAPNSECVALNIKMPLNLGQYCLYVGVKMPNGGGFPINDNMFWFGEAQINAGDWVFVYTGLGETRVSDMPNSSSKIYSIHWNRNSTLFHSAEVIPLLVRIDAVQVLQEAPKLPNKATGRV